MLAAPTTTTKKPKVLIPKKGTPPRSRSNFFHQVKLFEKPPLLNTVEKAIIQKIGRSYSSDVRKMSANGEKNSTTNANFAHKS